MAAARPGLGASTLHLYESLLGWAEDVEEIADRFGLDRFGLVGPSGGGAYVLACAHQLAERVVGGALLGGVAPASGDDAPAGGALGFAVRGRRQTGSFRAQVPPPRNYVSRRRRRRREEAERMS